MESRRMRPRCGPALLLLAHLLLAQWMAISSAWSQEPATGAAPEPQGQVLSERSRYYSVVTQTGELKHYRASWRSFLNPEGGGTGKTGLPRCGLVTTRWSLAEIAYPSLEFLRDARPAREEVSDLMGNEGGVGKCPDAVRLRAIIARYLQSRAALHDSLLEAELSQLTGPSRRVESWVFPQQVEIRFSPGDPDSVLAEAYGALHSYGMLPTRTVAYDTEATLAANLRRWDVVFNRPTEPLEDLLAELNADNPSVKVRRHVLKSRSRYLVIRDDRPVWLIVPDTQWKAIETIRELDVPSSKSLAAFLTDNGLYRAQLSGRNVPLTSNKAKARRIFELNRATYERLKVAASDSEAVLNAMNLRMKLPLDTIVLPFPRQQLQSLLIDSPALASQISDVADPSRVQLKTSNARRGALAAPRAAAASAAAVEPRSPDDCADPGQVRFGRNLEAMGIPARRQMTSAAKVFIFDSFAVPPAVISALDQRRGFIRAYYNHLRTKADYASMRGEGFHVATTNGELPQSLNIDYCKLFELSPEVCGPLQQAVSSRAEAYSGDEIAEMEAPRQRSVLDELRANPEFLPNARRVAPPNANPGQLRRDGNHGYHIAGIIAARCNGYGFAGAVAGIDLVPYAIASATDPPELSSITFENLARAVDSVAGAGSCFDKEPCIVNISATEEAGNISKGFVRTIGDSKDSILVVAAAGETTDNESCTSDNPAVPTCIGYPFRTNVLTVAAGQMVEAAGRKPRKELMQSSGYGPHVALAAPGNAILSIGHQGNLLGSGTSQAAAFVTGLAAAMQPSGSATQIAERILYTVDLDSGIAPDKVSFGWVNAHRALTGTGKSWLAIDGGDPTPGNLSVPNANAKLYVHWRSGREPLEIKPASVRRIFRDRSKQDLFSYVVIYRGSDGVYPSPAERMRDPQGTQAQRLNCSLKIVRDVYFLPLGPDNVVRGTDSMCAAGSWNCPLKIFEFTPDGGNAQLVRLTALDDLVVRMGTNVDRPESGKCQ